MGNIKVGSLVRFGCDVRTGVLDHVFNVLAVSDDGFLARIAIRDSGIIISWVPSDKLELYTGV